MPQANFFIVLNTAGKIDEILLTCISDDDLPQVRCHYQQDNPIDISILYRSLRCCCREMLECNQLTHFERPSKDGTATTAMLEQLEITSVNKITKQLNDVIE